MKIINLYVNHMSLCKMPEPFPQNAQDYQDIFSIYKAFSCMPDQTTPHDEMHKPL
jgi:hypothetical protein